MSKQTLPYLAINRRKAAMQTNYVFLLNADKSPLGMIHPARARELQGKNKAATFRRYPYVLILKNQVNSVIKPCILKIDPGSKWTGFAIQLTFVRVPYIPQFWRTLN
jgi:RRXRR protein